MRCRFDSGNSLIRVIGQQPLHQIQTLKVVGLKNRAQLLRFPFWEAKKV